MSMSASGRRSKRSSTGARLSSTVRPRGYRVPGNDFDPTVLDGAVRVGTPVSVDSEPEIREQATDHVRRVVREVEVPFERKVRVPVEHRKIVEKRETVRVPVRRLKEVPVTRTVEEKYVDYEEVPAVRKKEIWVKKIVDEEYMKRVPVTRTRTKKVKDKELREVTEEVEVEVPRDEVATTKGYRIDTVKDTKIVEVEELERYKLVPEKTGEREVVKTHEIGTVRKRDGGKGHLERTIGYDVYDSDDAASVSTDSDPDDSYVPVAPRTRSLNATSTRSRAIVSKSSYEHSSRRPVSRGGDPFASTRTRALNVSTSSRPTTASAGGLLGVVIRNAERGGCRVTRVLDRSPAHHAGIKVNDIIVDVDNHNTRDLSAFRDAVVRTGGLVHVSVKRAGTIITVKCIRNDYRR